MHLLLTSGDFYCRLLNTQVLLHFVSTQSVEYQERNLASNPQRFFP